MTKPPYEIEDYVLEELGAAERAEMEAWLAGSAEGRAEAERLRLTVSALRALPDEEPARRIAFVSDKIFEPSAWARLRRWFALEAPRLALGTAALLAVVFAGAWATQPRVSAGPEGWTLSFGASPAGEAAPSGGLDEARLRAVVAEALSARDAEVREALAEAVETRAVRSEAKFAAELRAVQQDLDSSLRIVNGNYEQIYRELARSTLAVSR
jgi:hypothetical protein